jgi:hypothetical protein
MKTKIFEENKTFCFTPENKMDKWKKLIYQKAREGNIVKLYSDTESTGFVWSNRGRPIYDPQTDKKSLTRDSMAFDIPLHKLEKEARELEGKVDRLIEYAFVACYTDKQGDTHLLVDEDGDAVYLHEMIHPNKDELVPINKRITQVPLVPYQIHKTSFDFLDGNEEHPFLGVKLPHPAPSAEVFFNELISWFRGYEDDSVFDNIYMFFHNGDDFDVPFIDAELNRATDGEVTLRDLVQTYDTLKIIKNILPSDVQKFISKCQNDEFYGGDSSIKDNKEVNIQPTQKNLDNVVRIAKFLMHFDPNKPDSLHKKWQNSYAKKMLKITRDNDINTWENLDNYFSNPSVDIDLSTGTTNLVKTSDELKKTIDGYKKFRTNLSDYKKQFNAMSKHEKVIKNLFNLRNTIQTKPCLQDALNRLHNTDRSAHGARVDSQLFMDALIVIEGAFYPKPKLSIAPNRGLKDIDDIKIPENIINDFQKKRDVIEVDNHNDLLNSVKKIDEKYNNLNKTDKKLKNKIR